MIKKFKNAFLLALSCTFILTAINVKAEESIDVKLPVGGNYYFLSQGYSGPVKSISCVKQSGNIDPLNTGDKNGVSAFFSCSAPGTAQYYCTAKIPSFIIFTKLEMKYFNVTCTGGASSASGSSSSSGSNSSSGGEKCYICKANYFYSSTAPCDGAVDVGIDNKEECLKLNPTTCRLCGSKYTWTDDPNCDFIGSPTNKTDCEAKNGSSSTTGGSQTGQSGNGSSTGGNSTGGSSTGGSTTPNVGGNVSPSQTTYPVDNNRVGISDYAEKEVTLDPPSRATNTVTGTCEDYIVTEEGSMPGGPVLHYAKGSYLYYSAKTNCTDNQGQEFVAFCVDPAVYGPKPSANYAIDKYIDPNDGEFSKGVVYVYKEFLKTGMSLMDRCAAENAIRYLEYDPTVSGGIATRTSGKFGADAVAYQNAIAANTPASGDSCSAQGWAWYQAAKTASVSDVSEGYGVANVEIVPDSDYSQDDEGNVSGHLLVQTPSGERIDGNITITCPSGATCTDEGNGRIAISGTLSCGDNKLTAAVSGASSDSNIKSALLVVNKKEPGRQRFVLFQTGGSVSAGASFEFDGVKNCSECQTNVDFACVPEGSYNNPIILKEGTINGEGETDWAACVYNGTDEKGNTFNALKNDYCVVSCTEEWDFRLPGNIQTVSGRNFSFSAQIGAKRTCKEVGDGSGKGVITPVNYRRADGNNGGHTSFVRDYNEAAKEMVDQYNIYLRQRAIVEAIELYIKENKGKKTLPTSRADDCFGEAKKTTAKYEGKSEYSYYEGDPNLSLTNSKLEHPYTHMYSFVATRYNAKVKDGKPTTNLTYNLISNAKVDDVTDSQEHSKTTKVCLSNGRHCVPQEEKCTENRYETYEDPNNKEYESTLRTERGLMETALNKYRAAVSRIEEIQEMYNECTTWENKYTFDPEIRFTYQEESYMDLLLQHQNKNYLINRTELENERTSPLSTYDIEIAVGTPGTNLELGSGNATFAWPVNPPSCNYGYGDNGDQGMDMTADANQPIYAAGAGTVFEVKNGVGELGLGASDKDASSWGNYVVIQHDNGYFTRYAHLNTIVVSEGAAVSQGTLIGYAGKTGRASSEHLHFEVATGVTRGSSGNRYNPADFLPMDGLPAKCFGNGGGAAGDLEGNVFLGDERSAGPVYQIIREGSWPPADFVVTEATYGESEVEYKAEETEYRSGVYFYTINPSGRVTTDKNAEGAKPLGYVYPVSLNTPQGDYPYYLNFGYVGMYNDSNRLGRIMGAAESSVLSGDAADYVCKYNVCDPTMQDCPPQMCDVVTDGNGNTHYYDKEGNETDKDTHDKQCASRDKVCTREKDENGNDVFCDANGNCSPDPSSYLKSCAKDCAGYTLVGYESYTGAKVESSGRLQFLPKVVSLNNLFSAGNQSAKAINWQNGKAQTARNEIESQGEKIFANSQYEFNLSPSAMAAIRNYNREQENNDKGYGDFNAHCNEYGSDCQSYFLDNISNMGVDVVKRDTSFTHDAKGYSYK